MALEEKNVLQAIDAAIRRHETTVIEAALSTASDKDKDFLRAMAEDDGPVTAGDIGKRLNAKSNVVANYRARLIAAGLIEAQLKARSTSPCQVCGSTSVRKTPDNDFDGRAGGDGAGAMEKSSESFLMTPLPHPCCSR